MGACLPLLLLLVVPGAAADGGLAPGPAFEGISARSLVTDPDRDDDGDGDGDGDDTDDGTPSGLEREGVTGAAACADGGLLYSADLDDAELRRRFVEAPATLGSVSVGVAEAGRVINAVQLPRTSAAWQVVDPANAWGTQETIAALTLVAQEVHDAFPDAVLRINHLGRASGGWLRPHQSHQSGRDADLGFYYQTGVDPGRLQRTREQSIDLPRNWALLRALVINADVQFILVDRRVQRVLYDYALAIGEDRAWLDRLFKAPDALVKHARRHRDHFHVRFFAPRSQELGRRILPLLQVRPDENVRIHRVARGDTLGRLALRYSSTVRLIQQANGLRGTALRVGRTLNVPVRGPCTSCPMPPPLVVPPRLLPPERGPAS